MSTDEDNPYVLATCPTCGVIHTDSSPHSYRYIDDVAFFDEHQLRDPINLEPIFNPVCLAPPCRHIFSKYTIEATICQHGCCPLDRTPQTLSNVIPAPFLVQNLLDKIRVFIYFTFTFTFKWMHCRNKHILYFCCCCFCLSCLDG